MYNSWPDMNGNFLPDDIDKADLYKSDLFNSASVVQFYHRFIAYLLIFFLLILNFFFYNSKIKSVSIIFFNLAVLFQIILGIMTLLTGVKIYYASLHQLGSVFVLTSFLCVYYKNTN